MKQRAIRLGHIMSSICTQDLDLANDFIVVDRLLANHLRPHIITHMLDDLLSYHKPIRGLLCMHRLVRLRGPGDQGTKGSATKRCRASATGDPWALVQCLSQPPIIILRCLDSEGESYILPRLIRSPRTDPLLLRAGLPTCPNCKQQVRVKLYIRHRRFMQT